MCETATKILVQTVKLTTIKLWSCISEAKNKTLIM